MQQEVEFPAAIAFIPQDCGDVVVRVAGVDGERQSRQSGGANMGPEAGLLHVARRSIVEIVQAGFADADDPLVAGERGDGFGRRDRRFGRMVRMHAYGTPEIGLRFDHRRQSLRLRQCGADGDHLADAGGGRTREDVRTFGLGEVVEMAVRIDQHQCIRPPARRSAGTRPAVPAAPRRPSASNPDRPGSAHPPARQADRASGSCCRA